MTSIADFRCRCAACGAVSTQYRLMSTSRSGSSDLDHKPPPRMLYTMSLWLKECPECLYPARDLTAIGAGERSAMKEIGFIEAGLEPGTPELAGRFLRRAWIDEAIDDMAGAAERLIQAAWVFDGWELDAARFRLRAADLLASLPDPDIVRRMRRLDLLRRGRRFDAALALAEELLADKLEADDRRIVVYQRRAIYQKQSHAVSRSQAIADTPRPRGWGKVIVFPRPEGRDAPDRDDG